MKYCYLLLSLASVCFCSNAFAVTYYVDASLGNDGWSGTSASVTSTNGPWQSIAKVNSATLKPGDKVLFSCGQTWYETLKPSNSGSVAARIYFGSYPTGCANKPKISGFRPIPGQNWQPHQGNIWKTTFPQNLIINGNLSISLANWRKWPSDAKQTFNSTCPLSVAGCMSFLAGTSTSNSLVISNSFSITGGQNYAGTISFYAPSGTTVALVVRENGNNYGSLGLFKKVTGNGQWQEISVQFTATRTVSNARLDIEVPQSKQIYVRLARVQQNAIQAKPNWLQFGGDPVTIAHHPNQGHNSSKPESVYLLTPAVSPTIIDSTGRPGSSQISVPDLKLPSGVSISPGTKLKLHDRDYEVNDFSVTSIGANTLTFAPNTQYPLSNKGLGFYFYDALWMLDSAGEWFFEESSQTLYLWTPDSSNPGERISLSALNTAIDLRTKSNLTVENLEIDGASTGINATDTENVKIGSLNIHNIEGSAVEARNSINISIVSNRMNRAGLLGVNAKNSNNPIIENNKLTEIGVFLKGGKPISLPLTTETAIFGGSKAIISDNYLSDIGRFGIVGQNDSDITSNVVQRSCFTFNDCGGIYVYSLSSWTSINNNLILEVPGDMDGVTDNHSKHLVGIYLDNGVQGVSVTGNTVKGATISIQLHNSNQSTISDNILYGAEDRLIWQQEDSMANGGIYGNKITNNQLFPTSKYAVGILSNTIADHVDNFATYDGNYHSTIHSPVIASERGLKVSQDYKFPDWQTATTAAGALRNNDLNGGTPAPLPKFAQGLVGNDFVINGDFSAGLEGWDSWNAVSPKASEILEGCLPVSVNCLHVTAGGSTTLAHSPLFSISKGKLYRVTFDLKSTFKDGYLYPVVLFAGPTKYNSLFNDTRRFIASTEWKRYSFIFEATDSAPNPNIDDQGARFDIGGLPTGQNLWIANLEIAPFDLGVLGPTRTDLLVNSTDVDKTIDCPTRMSSPGLCSNFVNFPEASVAVWPISVSPRSGRIVFTQNFTLLDSDGDGIANSQDDCPQTVKGETVNGKGCSLTD